MLAGGFITPEAKAVLIAQQSFDGNAFGYNLGNNPYAYETGTVQSGLTYLTLTTSGSSRNFGTSPTANVITPGGALPETGTFFISWLMDTTNNANMTIFTSGFFDGNGPGGGGEIGGFGIQNNLVNFFKANYGPQPPNNFTNIPTAITPTAGTHLFVIGYTTDLATNTSSFNFYFDPTSSVAPTPVLTYSGGLPSFRAEQFRATGSATWDEFRIGTTFADVTPGLPVPEPGSFVLLGLGMAVVYFRRKKRITELKS